MTHKTYVGLDATNSPPKKPSVLHSIVVSSADGLVAGEEVLTRLKETVNAKEGWTKVEQVRQR